MEEVSNPYGLSGLRGQDAATLAAVEEGMALKDKDVYDVNGQKLGRITRAFAEEGALLRFDVKLTAQAKRIFGAEQDIAGVPAVVVSDVEGDRVRLSEAGEQILHPDDPRPISAASDERGAQDLPRKNR